MEPEGAVLVSFFVGQVKSLLGPFFPSSIPEESPLVVVKAPGISRFTGGEVTVEYVPSILTDKADGSNREQIPLRIARDENGKWRAFYHGSKVRHLEVETSLIRMGICDMDLTLEK